jgi:hypothetical protein
MSTTKEKSIQWANFEARHPKWKSSKGIFFTTPPWQAERCEAAPAFGQLYFGT